jgi:hypothetical protein
LPSPSDSKNKIEEWLDYFKEAREIRRKYANWEFIKSQPPRLRAALEYYIETGDYRTAAKMAGMAIDEFVDFAKDKANILTVD